MPHWNMGVQDLVNKWVKVNKTHVVYLNENDRKALPSSTTITTATTGSHPAARTTRGGSLVRTNSQSDLLKETFYDDEAGGDHAKHHAHSKLSRNYRRSKKKHREKQQQQHAVVVPPPRPVELLVDGMCKKQPENSGIQQQQQPPYPTRDHHLPPPPSSDNRDPHHCDACRHMQRQIQIMSVDIQSLRSLALKYEQQQQHNNFHKQHDAQSVGTDASSSVVRFKKSSKKKRGSVISAASSVATVDSRGSTTVYNEPASVMEASQRLDDVTVRHKRQVELMAKERIRWQNDMQLKLSKFALMAKELNEESAMRKRESQAALDELSIATAERDALSFQVEQLQAQLATQERYQRENEILRDELIRRDDGLLNRCHDAIEKRDVIIRELTSRLRVTMLTLEREREVQRSRRIIFPSARLQSQQQRLVSDESVVDRTTTDEDGYSAAADEMEIRELKERLIQMKQSESLARLELEDFKSKALKTEDMLRGRCERLQDQLTGGSKERILKCSG